MNKINQQDKATLVAALQELPEKVQASMADLEIIKKTANIEKRAKLIEEKCNSMESEGYNLISVCSTPNFGAILVFKKG